MSKSLPKGQFRDVLLGQDMVKSVPRTSIKRKTCSCVQCVVHATVLVVQTLCSGFSTSMIFPNVDPFMI